MGVWSLGQVQWSQLSGRSTNDAVSKRELELGVVELEGRNTLAVLGSDGGGSDDLDGLVAGSVTTSHVAIC